MSHGVGVGGGVWLVGVLVQAFGRQEFPHLSHECEAEALLVLTNPELSQLGRHSPHGPFEEAVH